MKEILQDVSRSPISVATKSIVYKMLRDYEGCRNNDVYLVWQVWNEYSRSIIGKQIFIDYDVFQQLPSPETITRQRRLFNAKGMFTPTKPEVIEQRAKREDDFIVQSVRGKL